MRSILKTLGLTLAVTAALALAVTLAVAAPEVVMSVCPIISLWVVFGGKDEEDE